MARSTRSSLDRKLIAGCMIMLAFSLLLSVGLIAIFQKDYERASRNLDALKLYRLVLIAANQLSAERGPTNSLLAEEPAADSPARRRLDEFRRSTDAALDAISPAGAVSGRPAQDDFVPRDSLERVRASLARARSSVDELAARPRGERTGDGIRRVIWNMFDVVEVMRPVVAATMVSIASQDQTLAGPALMGQMLGDLREYAGRMGSYLASPLATRQPLSSDALDDLHRTRGRILQLWQLAEQQTDFYADDPGLLAARQAVSTGYFADGLALIDRLTAEGQRSGNYSMTTQQMTAAYVPTLEPIERLRVGFLDKAIERPRQLRQDALDWLLRVSAITCLIVLTKIALVIAARRLVFRPLLQARDHIIALSEGRDLDRPLGHAGAAETRRLFDAIEVLRLKLRERLQATQRLKIQAETDGLTGLLNRRSLDRIGQGDPDFSYLPSEIGLILMDVDHFKSINDSHGHLAGDVALKAIANLVQTMIRKSDIAARYGGEEIAIILPFASLTTVASIAENIRLALERSPIDTGDGGRITTTASFGVAAGSRGQAGWGSLLQAADEALYEAKANGRNQVRPVIDVTLPADAGEPALSR